jgi:hypothetical protein
MKKQYLITREQLDSVVANYLDEKMRGGRVKTVRNRFSKSSMLNAFITPDDKVLFILYEWAESWEDDDGPRNVLSIDEGLVDFFVRHIGVRKHKAMDIISDWFHETYDFDFDGIELGDSLKSIMRGWEK